MSNQLGIFEVANQLTGKIPAEKVLEGINKAKNEKGPNALLDSKLITYYFGYSHIEIVDGVIRKKRQSTLPPSSCTAPKRKITMPSHTGVPCKKQPRQQQEDLVYPATPDPYLSASDNDSSAGDDFFFADNLEELLLHPTPPAPPAQQPQQQQQQPLIEYKLPRNYKLALNKLKSASQKLEVHLQNVMTKVNRISKDLVKINEKSDGLMTKLDSIEETL